MALRVINANFLSRLVVVSSRNIQTTSINLGADAREKRLGHKEQSDKLEGEQGTYIEPTKGSFELVDENLMDKVINNVKFKDIPIIYMRCSRNNTKITLAQGDWTQICRKSGGSEGFKNCRKGTTVAAQAVANRILSVAADNEITMARLVFSGLGPGRDAAFRVFEMNNFKIVSLTDRTDAAEPYNRRPRAAKSI